MNWMKENAIGLVMAMVTCFGAFGSAVYMYSTLDQRVRNIENGDDSKQVGVNSSDIKVIRAEIGRHSDSLEGHDFQMKVLYDDLNIVKTDTAVTNKILIEFGASVKQLSDNTAALTQVVARLDERVKAIENSAVMQHDARIKALEERAMKSEKE